MSYINTFKTYLDLDLTIQSNQNINADGTFTLAGMTWTKGNSTNEATHLAITNGTGAIFKPAATSDYQGTTRTLPYIWLPLIQIGGLESLNWQSRIRYWVNVSADNCAADYDDSVIALDNNANSFTYQSKRGFQAQISAIGLVGECGVNPNNNGFGTNLVLGAANRVVMMDIDLSRFSFSLFYGSNTSIWPATSSLTYAGTQTIGNVGLTANGYSSPASTLGLTMGAQRATSATSLSITYANVRLDVLQY